MTYTMLGLHLQVKQTSGSILWVGLTSAKLILGLLSPFSTRCTGFAVFDATVPCGPFVTFLKFKFPARSKLWSMTVTRPTAQDVKDDDGKTSEKGSFHDQKKVIHESRIPHEMNHASHAFRYSRITFPFM